MKVKKFIQWLPGIVSELIAVLFCIIYAVTDGSKNIVYPELLVAALLPFVFPVLGIITKKTFPIALSILYAVFIFCASVLGSGVDLYHKLHCWDLIIHGVFGFMCSLTVYVLLIRWNGSALNRVGFMLIICTVTMGVAALWEVWEYSTDLITGADSQMVAESIALGKSPVADTMEDIMIAMAGSAVFFVALIIDKFSGHKMYFRLCGFEGFNKCNNCEE